MATYRAYVVAAGGRLQLGETFDAPDDEAAVAHVQALGRPTAMELWEAGRLIGRVSKLGVFTPVEA